MSPVHFLTGFALGILGGALRGNGLVEIAKEGDCTVSLHCYSEENEKTQRKAAVKELKHVLPGLATTGLTLSACYVLVSKVSLPIIFVPLLFGTGGLFLGFTLGKYFSLDHLNRWAQQKNDQLVLDALQDVVL